MSSRREKIVEMLNFTPAMNWNDWPVPEDPKRYLVVEKASGDIVWAAGVETLEEAAAFLYESETDRDTALAYDLDTEDPTDPMGCKVLVPIFKVEKWL
jgi:hypothetical protein